MKDLPKEHHNFRIYLVLLSLFHTFFFLFFSIRVNIASNECWEIFFSHIVSDNLPINLWYGYLFAYINNIQMVLIKVAVCLLVYNRTCHDRPFVHTGDISVFFSSLKNAEFLMFWLKHSVKISAIISELHLKTWYIGFWDSTFIFYIANVPFHALKLEYLQENTFESWKYFSLAKYLDDFYIFSCLCYWADFFLHNIRK